MDDVLRGGIELAFGLCAVLSDGVVSVGIEHPDCLCRIVIETNVWQFDTTAPVNVHDVTVRIHPDGTKAMVWIDGQEEGTMVTPESSVDECGPTS